MPKLPRSLVVSIPALAGLLGASGCFGTSNGGPADAGGYRSPDAVTPDFDAAGMPDTVVPEDAPSGADDSGGSVPDAADAGPQFTLRLYVDVTNGLDTNACTQVAPCKTIHKAMMGAPFGSVVYLADGTYGSATQGTGFTIPDGVTLAATNPGGATLTYQSITAAGSATVDDVVFAPEGFMGTGITAKSSTGTPTLTLRGVLIKNYSAVTLGGTVHATMTPGALAGGVYTAALTNSYGPMITVDSAATLTVTGGIIDGNNVGAPAFGAGLLGVANSASLTLDGVTVRNWTSVAVSANDTATATLKNGTLIDNVGLADNCPTGSAIVLTGTPTLTVDHSQLSNIASAAICVRSGPGAATVHVVSSTIDKAVSGIASEIGPGSIANVTITSSSVTHGTNGINWSGLAASTFTLSAATLTGNQTGITFNGAGSLKLRGTSVFSNTDTGIALYSTVTADLGTTADPGLNTFTGNTNVGLKDNRTSGPTLQVVGNTWNASTQSADANGHYSTSPSFTPVLEMGPTSGANFSINGALADDL